MAMRSAAREMALRREKARASALSANDGSGRMDLELTTSIFLLLGLAAFAAGTVDAAVGGGGLIQVPALLLSFPQAPLATLFGTNKLASVVGTSSAAWQYLRRVRLPGSLLAVVVLCAAVGSALGASAIAFFPKEWARPVVVALLIAVAVYTFWHKQFGWHQRSAAWSVWDRWKAGTAAGGIGAYDGFFGPGTGSFYIFAFVRWLHLDFLHASALAKVANATTNVAAIATFAWHGELWWMLGAWMGACNFLGARVGTALAFRYGVVWLRRAFLTVVVLTVTRLILW